jgi:hypothetical protein
MATRTPNRRLIEEGTGLPFKSVSAFQLDHNKRGGNRYRFQETK